MGSFLNIDVASDFFTPQEYPVEILEIAKANDVIPCCLNFPSKQFLSFMLMKEYYFLHNGITLFIQDPPQSEDLDLDMNLLDILKNEAADKGEFCPPSVHVPLESLSNIPTVRLNDSGGEAGFAKQRERLLNLQPPFAVFCSRKKFLELVKDPAYWNFQKERISLVVCDNVHEALRKQEARERLEEIIGVIRSCNKEREVTGNAPIRTVFLTLSFLHFYGNENAGFWRMKETFRKLEFLCKAKVDTSSDATALLRYSVPLKERIVHMDPKFLEESPRKLVEEMKDVLVSLKKFLSTHEFDPIAAFGYDPNAPKSLVEVEAEEEVGSDTDSIAEEIKKINHPNSEPLQIIATFERVMENFGPWCADRSLFLLLQLVDRLKVRTPYERHYLLLGALQTRLFILQAGFYKVFKDMDPLEVIEKYSTPKLLCLLQILRRFDLTTPIEPLKSRRIMIEDDDDEDFDEDMDNSEGPVRQEQTAKSCRDKRRKNVRWDNARKGDTKKGRNKKKPVNKLGSAADAITEGTSEGAVVIEIEPGTEITEAPPEIKDTPTQAGPQDVTNEEDKTIIPENVETVTAKRRGKRFPKRPKNLRAQDPALCGIVFVKDRFDARILFHFLKEVARLDSRLIGLSPTLAICSTAEFGKDSRELEMEHKKREDNLRKFRYREANLLIATAIVEGGIELPKANLVVRFDAPKSFRSYLLSKGRAQGKEAEFFIFTDTETLPSCLRQLATYRLVQDILLAHSIVPKTHLVEYGMQPETELKFPHFKTATLSNSIGIVNRYCARLPSDTFTRLVPLWKLETVNDGDKTKYKCSLRLPINSPVNWTIQGIPMPTISFAKKAVALQTVVILHGNGELDDSLMPIGKEGILPEPDLKVVPDPDEEEEYGEFRPGSTKRRQYYDKKLANELVACLPNEESPVHLYWIQMVLTCPLPDEQNTRGRKLHPPELCTQSFGILLSKDIELVPAFPIYTRCGEVQVQLVKVPSPDKTKLTAETLEKISTFHHYSFTAVLRLDKYLTLFDPTLSENSYYVVPLRAVEFARDLTTGLLDITSRKMEIDWEFLDTIWDTRHCTRPLPKSDEERKDYTFRKEDYEDAVVMPWYRSHDAPQYFYVAEICKNLTPKSQFPGCEFKTFQEYYQKKYNIGIQCVEQPLLDVDHTSARLNFLTPRYVNRKGMALPTSSESTKKAKRENLEQKQILVPELCGIHPFSASLWRQAVCLPCILYRLNCLLLANSIRHIVAREIRGLGLTRLHQGFQWEALSFGWSLSDLQFPPNTEKLEITDGKNEDESSAENDGPSNCKADNPDQSMEDKTKKSYEKPEEELTGFAKAAKEPLSSGVTLGEALLMNEKHLGKSANEILSEEMKKCKPPTLEIGMWSNDMASSTEQPEPDFEEEEDELLDPMIAFPSNLMMLDKNWTWGGRSRLFNHKVHRALYGSPTHWGEVWDQDAFIPIEDLDDPAGHHYPDDAASVASDGSGSDASFIDEENSVKIQFHSGNTAEAMDKRKFGFDRDEEMWNVSEDLWWPMEGTEDTLTTTEDKPEEILRQEFEKEVDEKVPEMSGIFSWNEISLLPPRSSSDEATESNSTDEVDNAYTHVLEDTTQVRPPPLFPASKNFYNEGRNSLVDSPSSFSFDYQPNLRTHPGPSPCRILQALTMSNANDGLNLERLETIGDSFLKYAITSYLFCAYENIHEGKLSHLRSKQVSNVHLYRLGRRRELGKVMVATKFEPHDNWLPPGYHIPNDLEKALISSKLPPSHVSMAQVAALKNMSPTEMETALRNHSVKSEAEFIPYNLVTQQSIPDKSIADCVEALIGAYLTSMGSRGALLFMSWLGMRVLPSIIVKKEKLDSFLSTEKESIYMELPNSDDVIIFQNLAPPKSPLLRYTADCEQQLEVLLKGYDEFENAVGYKFRDRSYLLQAFTHASYSANTLTDCYQRLEFLGDAILDYLITRHLYEDPRQHSPGSLTDLRSALVNNTIFASLAVKNNFHKYFRHASPGLGGVLQKFVTFQEQHGYTLTQDYYLMDEEECEEAEDIEVPKALGDVFESVAGAIYLDSNLSLDAVWNVYYRIMKGEIEAFSKNVPKSPIRELLELEPETAKFGKPEKLWDGRRVRVTVEIFGVGVFRGIGRNYRIAKCTAAKCALRHVRKLRQNQTRRNC